VYAVCRSSDPEASRHGLDCFRRIILRTQIDQIPDEKWIAILYLMVNKQPPLVAEVSRGNTFTILGHLLARVLPTLTHRENLREDLVDIITQLAALTEENLRQSRRGAASPLFEKTLQTATYLSNHMISDEWGGERRISTWASETLLSELEKVGTSVISYTKRSKGSGKHNSVIEKVNGEESDVSELSATEDNGEDE
jgi:hypothetical protein